MYTASEFKNSERVNIMIEIKNTTALVAELLIQNEQCRNSDSYLYLKVLSVMARHKGINIYEMSVPVFLLTMKENGFPPFETVRRARQKIQAEHPDLAACESVKEFRAENEAKYRAFARGEA